MSTRTYELVMCGMVIDDDGSRLVEPGEASHFFNVHIKVYVDDDLTDVIVDVDFDSLTEACEMFNGVQALFPDMPFEMLDL
jgi:hypothetical protein